MAQARLICTSCGQVGSPKMAVKGNLAIEIILWSCFIIPGLIYSLWRQGSYHKVCPVCKKDTLIPVDTPNGRRLLEQSGKSLTEFEEEEKTHKVSSRKHLKYIIATLIALGFLGWLGSLLGK